MNIIIVGCEKVGSTLAAQLNAEGNNVTIIDRDAVKVKTLPGKRADAKSAPSQINA